MNITKKMLLGFLLLGVVPTTHAWFDFDEFDHYFDKINRQFKKQTKFINKQVKSLQKPLHSNISIREEKDHVSIIIPGIDAQELEATLNEKNDRLSIVTPEQRITISTKGNRIDIATAQEKKEIKEKKNKDQISEHYFGSTYSSISQTVGTPLALEKQTIDYDQENKKLIINIPKQETKKDKLVPINKIGTQKIIVDSKSQEKESDEK